jgi:hypothetical protein
MSTFAPHRAHLRIDPGRHLPPLAQPPAAPGRGLPRRPAWPELELLSGVGQVRHYGPYRVRTIAEPAASLDSEHAHALRAMCVRGSRPAFGVDMSAYWQARQRYFDELAEWTVADCRGDLAGWHGLAVWGADCGTVLYTDMLVTLPAHRHSGLGAFLAAGAWLRVAPRTRSLPILACRTQNPIVMRMMCQFGTTTYPRTDGRPDGPQYKRAEQAARLIAIHKRTGTAPARGTFVSRGAFPGPLCTHLPSSRDARIDDFFRQLDLRAGDAVYVVELVSPLGAICAAARQGALAIPLAAQPRRRRNGGTS